MIVWEHSGGRETTMEVSADRSGLNTAEISAANSSLDRDRLIVEARLVELLEPEGGESRFHEAMRYAVLGQGQRFRPVLSLRVARFRAQENELTLRAASAVELLHCASLVVDDLPCMDNQPVRRNRAATHVAFGEATALLAAFGLVALSARSVVEAPCEEHQKPALLRFQCELLRALDVRGLCEGQEIDLRAASGEFGEARTRIDELKTVPLFDLAAQAGLLFADPGGTVTKILRASARELGRAYQAVDDCVDGDVTGSESARVRLKAASDCLRTLDQEPVELQELVSLLGARLA